MRVAICDDEIMDLASLSDALKRYCAKSLKVSSFSNARSLLLGARKTQYDIVILDIEMPGQNGYDAALQLNAVEPKPIIIFLTNSTAYTLCGYGVAFRYLTKPIVDAQLFSAMDAAIREVEANRFVFNMDGGDHVLRLDDIYYLEICDHYTILHTIDCEYSFRATLKDVVSQLPSGYFAMPHQSFVVGFAHIKTSTSKEIRLTNGASIPVSRRKQKEFYAQFHRYLRR